jgi:hypothetical protein
LTGSAAQKRGKSLSSTNFTFEQKFSELKESLLRGIKEGKEFSDQELLNFIKPIVSAEILLPISIFKNQLSTLESVVLYLLDHKNLKFYEIAKLLNRNQRTIWGAYRRAKKRKENLFIEDSEIKIKISIFAERKKAPLQSLVSYLKENFSLNYSQIARLLSLDPRTVWTVYQIAKKK